MSVQIPTDSQSERERDAGLGFILVQLNTSPEWKSSIINTPVLSKTCFGFVVSFIMSF